MAGYEVRRSRPVGQWKYPLATLWLLADLRDDIVTKVKVAVAVDDTIGGFTQGVIRRCYERWLDEYLHGER